MRESGSRKKSKYIQYSEKTTIIVVSIYTVLETAYNYIFWPRETGWMLRLGTGIFLIAALVALFRALEKERVRHRTVAWLVPTLFLLVQLVLTYIFNGEALFFWFLLGCSIICLTFLDNIALLIYIAISDAAVIILMYAMGVTVIGYRYDMVLHTIQFLAYNLVNVLLYSVCAFSTKHFKNYESTGKTFATIMETTPNYMVIINNDARVEYISRSLSQWLSLSHGQYAVGRPLLDLCQWGELKVMFQEVMEAGTYVEKSVELTLNDKRYGFLLRSSLMGSGGIARIFELSDITPVIEAKNEAEAATRAKSSFLANMSHEIRTPMNAIVGLTELMMLGELDSEQLSHALAIKASSMSLLNIINDILDFSKIDAKKMQIIPKPFDFVSLINDTINIINIKASSAAIAFTALISKDIPPTINGDELRIKQILLNLLNNAVKFTKKGCVSLRADSRVLEDGSLKLSFVVADTGIGIRSEGISKIFGEFEQMDVKKNHEIEGTGLGLAISRRLANLMDGEISVQSEYGKGSSFTFYVVCRGEHSGRIASLENASDYRALCYEPNYYHADALRSMLDSLGVPAVFCGSLGHLERELFGGNFTHVFFDKKAKAIVDDFPAPPEACLVMMKEIGDFAGTQIRTINRPVLITVLAKTLMGDAMLGYNSEIKNEIKLGAFKTSSARVLLVDDNAINLTVAEGLLRQYGIAVDTASGGREGIDKAKSGDYDIVFMDHMMPGIDGIEATRSIRAIEGRRGAVPIIALTANAISGVEKTFLQAGMSGFLAKPIVVSQLHGTLLEFLPPEKIINAG